MGEDVIDLIEYEVFRNGGERISYYQLKHTSVRQNDPFTLSDLEDTFTGFAQKYVQLKSDYIGKTLPELSFTLITNRPIGNTFKANISAVALKQNVDTRFKNTIEKYTNLPADELASFCGLLSLQDGEGNHVEQEFILKSELGQMMAGAVDNSFVERLVVLVQSKLLPEANGTITRETVLQRMGVTSERQLFPAPPAWDDSGRIIPRKHYTTLIEEITRSGLSAIVHAAGGVGKSVFCQQLVDSLPEGSIAIAYDCFGAGKYRKRSELRHQHRDALVQIANELAVKGLCSPLLPIGSMSEKDLMQKFLSLLGEAVKSLQKVRPAAQIFLLVDAADNAEMAAKEFNDSCFAHELLSETMPAACLLVMLCNDLQIVKQFDNCLHLFKKHPHLTFLFYK